MSRACARLGTQGADGVAGRVRDHVAEWAAWEERLAHIEAAVLRAAPEGRVRCSRWAPGKSNVVPQLDLRWEEAVGLRSPDEVVRMLSAGSPRIEVVPIGPAGDLDPADGAAVLRRRGGVVSTADYHWGVTPSWDGSGPGEACGVRINPSLMQEGEEEIVAAKLSAALTTGPGARL